MMKAFYFAALCLALLLAASCTTVQISTEPRFYSNNPNTEFEILGEVIYESADRVGYIELLRAARNLYPECDYVIDIMVDQKKVTTTMVFFAMSSTTEESTYVMRGTAVAYKRD